MWSWVDTNHVLMHVHILNKVWEQKSGDWDTNTVPHTGTQVSCNYAKGMEKYLELRLT